MARSDPDTFDAGGRPPAGTMGTSAMVMFLFLVIALAVVVAAVAVAVVGGGGSGGGESDGPLPDVTPERLQDPLPPDRPLNRADIESLRFPLTARGYRM